MNRRIRSSMARVAPITVALAALAGCASTTPTFDAEFGTSVRTLVVQQTRDPQAGVTNRDRSVDGMDGRAARETLLQYQRSYAEPAKEPAGGFSIGSGSQGVR